MPYLLTALVSEDIMFSCSNSVPTMRFLGFYFQVKVVWRYIVEIGFIVNQGGFESSS